MSSKVEMKIKMNKALIVSLILTIFLISCQTYTNTVDTTKSGASVDPAVIEALNNRERVSVIIDFYDNSGVEIPYKGELIFSDDPRRVEREAAIQKLSDYFNSVILNVSKSIPSEHLNLTHGVSSAGSAGGDITKEGLEILRYNPHVKNIHLNKVVKINLIPKENEDFTNENCFAYRQSQATHGSGDGAVAGQISVVFNESFEIDEVSNLIKSQNLTFRQSSIRPHTFSINVPQNQEVYWACWFEDKPQVIQSRLTFNGEGHTLESNIDQEVDVSTKIENVDYSKVDLDSLIIVFNGVQNEGIIATTKLNRTNGHLGGVNNENFKNYFQKDLDKISNDDKSIAYIEITHWYEIFYGGGIRIHYNSDLDESNKIILLNKVKSLLDKKWYIKQTDYNYLMSISN